MTVLPFQKNQKKTSSRRFANKHRGQQRAQIIEEQSQPQPMTVAEKVVWREKDKSLLVQEALKAQSKKAPYILDSGCTSHMTRDKSKLSNKDVLERLRTLLRIVRSH